MQGGKGFVVRYLGEDDTGENITREEADALHAAGLKIVLAYQTGKAFMLTGGFDRGVQAGEVSCEQATAIGWPGNRPVYFALDVDPNPLADEQWFTVTQFLAGACSVMGWGQVGLYGGRKAIDRLVPVAASWGWQTFAWSGYKKSEDPNVWADSRIQPIWSSVANLRQYRNGQEMCGGLVDFDQALTADFGQW